MAADRIRDSAAVGRHRDGHRDPSGGRRAWRDVGVLIAGQGLTQLLNLTALAVVARSLGVAQFGLVQVAIVISGYAMVSAEAGLFTLGVRDLARCQDRAARRRLVDERLGLLLALAAAAVVVCGLLLLASPWRTDDPVLLGIYLLAVIPQAVMLDWAALGLGATLGAGAARVSRAAVYTLLVATVWTASDGWLGQPARRWLGVVFLLSLAGGNLVAWLVVRSRLARSPRGVSPRRGPWRGILSASVPVGVANIIRRVLYGADLLMLGLLATSTAVGCYAAAAKFGFVLVVGVEVALGALLPRLSLAWSRGRGEFARVLRRQFLALTAVLATTAVIGLRLGPALLDRVFGSTYHGSGEILVLLMIAYPLLGVGLFLHEAQIAANRQRGALIPLAVAAGAVVAGGFVLIPAQGAAGAAKAMILAHGIYAVSGGVRCRDLWRA